MLTKDLAKKQKFDLWMIREEDYRVSMAQIFAI
jgi:hypothetical protein